MKTRVPFLRVVFLFSIPFHSFFCLAEKAPEPVHDIKGRRLRVDQPYSILPADPSTGRGFVMEVKNNKTCPFDVVQAQHDYEFPLQFYPVNSTKGDIIRLSTDLNIFFWDTFKKYFITTGGEKGNPGLETISNWFKIEKSGEQFYKFVYCPSVCETCKVLCEDVGIFVQDGKRRAALSDVPFEFSFQKFTGYLMSID